MTLPTSLSRAAHLALLLGLSILAWQTVIFGWVIAERKADPIAAARRAPNNSLVLAALAQEQLKQGNVAAARQAARRALRRDPANAAAAGVLSMASAQAGDLQNAVALLNYSQHMSRRDLPTHLWAIELAVQRGDIATALRHYDVALRVGRTMPEVLFPILATASSDPTIRLPLTRVLRSNAPWGASFLDYLSAQGTDLTSSATLIGDLQAGGSSVASGPVNILIQRLMEAGDTTRAWSLYARANPGTAGSTLRNGDFRKAPDMPTLFDWQVEDRGDARAEILANERGGEMQVEARNGAGGTVARQRLVLQPGLYDLAFHAQASDGATLGASIFNLVCMPSTSRIAHIDLAAGGAQRHVQISVPTGCREQSLEIVLDSGSSEATIDGRITNISLNRLVQRELQ
jgi:tetratricopeptide (TPR) repeat protein